MFAFIVSVARLKALVSIISLTVQEGTFGQQKFAFAISS